MGHLGRKIDTVTYSTTGESVSIFLDTKTGKFAAEHLGEIFRSEHLSEVKEGVHKSLEKNAQLDWIPIIEATQYDAGSWMVRGRDMEFLVVGLALDRRYIARLQTTEKSHRSVEWDVRPEERLKRANHEYDSFPELPFHDEDGRKHLFAYSETLWTGLNSIKDRIGVLDGQLKDLLGTKIKLIENHGALALLESGDGSAKAAQNRPVPRRRV